MDSSTRGTHHRDARWIFAGGTLATLLVLGLVALIAWPRGNRAGEPAPVITHDAAVARSLLPQIVKLKAEAERLAIEGRLAEAHEDYRRIEQMTAGLRISDTAIWDLVERAKQDQDRIYTLLIAERENKALAERIRLAEKIRADQQAEAPAPVETRPAAAADDLAKIFEQIPLRVSPKPVNPLAVTPAQPGYQPVRPEPSQTRQAQAAQPETGPSAVTPTTRPSATAGAGTVPSPRAVAAPSASELDGEIANAMRLGVKYLMSQMKADELEMIDAPSDTYREGANALVVYALLKAGRTLGDPQLNPSNQPMRGMVNRMKDHLMLVDDAHPTAPVTYARAYRAAALAVWNQAEDRRVLGNDAKWLLDSELDGAFSYNDSLTSDDARRAHDFPIIQDFHLRPGVLYYIGEPVETGRVLLDNGELNVPRSMVAPPGTNLGGRFGMGGSYQLAELLRQSMMQRADASGRKPRQAWDNSNTQVAVMALAAAAEAGYDVPAGFWQQVEHHCLFAERPTGEWGYDANNTDPSFSMTAGAIASLLCTHDFLDAPALGASTGRAPYNAGLVAGLRWLDADNRVLHPTSGVTRYLGYNLYNLARAGTLSGRKYFGNTDWYPVLAQRVLSAQRPSGAWGDKDSGRQPIIETAYMLLFLSTPRPPVFCNKLQYDGAWENRARDVAHLTRFASAQLERPLNWQIMPVSRDWTDWFDSPLLYISGHKAPRFTDAELGKLRSFAEAGGLIFCHADAGSSEFSTAMRKYASQCFPDATWRRLPGNDEIFSLNYTVKARPDLYALSNGSRILVLLCSTDIAAAWQLRDRTKQDLFELGMNVFFYASGKPQLRNRLVSPLLTMPAAKPAFEFTAARVRHGGIWNPEPAALGRFSTAFFLQTGWKVGYAPAAPGELDLKRTPLAFLTGTGELKLDDAGEKQLRAYVDAGGVLMVEACGGNPEFASSAAAMLARAFPGAQASNMGLAHPLLHASAPGMADIPVPALRPYARQKLGKNIPPLQTIQSGKGVVIFSPLDLSTGLLDAPTWPIMGYSPEYAQALMKNLVLWTAYGRPDTK